LIKSFQTFKNKFWASPSRVLIIFTIGIILPAGLLGYLGFRSFQYEGILLSKQSEQRYAAIADLMQKNANDFFSGLVDSLRVISGFEAFQQWNSPEMIRRLLGTLDIKGFPIKELYVFDEQDQMVVPFHSESHEDSSTAIPKDLDWGPFTDEIHRLERLEFVERNVAEAVKGYSSLRIKTLPDRLQAALLKNIASGYRKMNDWRSAEATYLELTKRFDQFPDPAGYPMGILGRQLLAELYDAAGQNGKALSTRLDLVEGLILSRWGLSASQQTLLLKQVKDAISQQLTRSLGSNDGARSRWTQLQSIQARTDSLRRAAQDFLRSEWPEAIKRLRSQGWLDKGGVLLVDSPTGDLREHELMVFSPIVDPATNRREGLLVAIANGEPVWKAVDTMLMNQAQSAGLKVGWGRSSFVPSWKASLERSIDAVNPPLTFQLFEPISDAQRNFLHRRMWTYGGMIGLSFVVILIGLIVMLQAIQREKENANLKAEFVANVSHELRTPLAAISYIGEKLNLGRYRTQEEVKEFYAMLGEETNHLRELIEDILDFSKMMGGKKVYQRETAQLNSVVQEAYDRFQTKAKAHGFTVSLELPGESVVVTIDRRATGQAILNLLDNALKYSGDSREIRLRLAVSPTEAIVSVQDFGIGIPPHEKDKIFEKFYRVQHALTRDTLGGVGLGLAIVKHIMEGQGGSVTFASETQRGTTFFLKFPRGGYS
jgi:signal transduction histidine kinase